MATSFRPSNPTGSKSFDEGMTVLLPHLRVHSVARQRHQLDGSNPRIAPKGQRLPLEPEGRLSVNHTAPLRRIARTAGSWSPPVSLHPAVMVRRMALRASPTLALL